MGILSKKKAHKKAGRSALAQDIMPLETVVGPVIHRRDGKKVVALAIDGRNDTLDTSQQKTSWGDALARALRGVQFPVMVVKIPRKVEGDEDLAMVDDALAGLASATGACDVRRRELLAERVRPECEREAQAGERTSQATYICLEFEPEVDDSRAREHAGELAVSLAAAGAPAWMLQAPEAVELLQAYFTPSRVDAARAEGPRPVLPEGRARRRAGNAGDAWLVSSVTPEIEEREHMVVADGRCLKTVFFDKYPSQVGPDWLDVLYRHSGYAISMRLDPLPESEIDAMVDYNEGNIKADLTNRRKLKASELDKLKREESHGSRMLELLGDESECFFGVTLYAVVEGADEEELEKNERDLRRAVKGMGLDFMHQRNCQLESWMAASPLMTPDKAASERGQTPIPASTVGWTCFAKSPGLDDLRGITLGEDPRGGTVRLDMALTSLRRLNRNVVIVGKSGGGKTVMAEHIALYWRLMYGARIIAIDPDRQFTSFARALGGRVVEVGGAGASKLSPLQPRAVTFSGGDEEEDEAARDDLVLAATIPFVKSFLRRAFALGKEDMAPLEEGLEIAYAKYGIDKGTTFGEYAARGLSYPLMEDVYNALNDLAARRGGRDRRYSRVADELRSAAVGIYSETWNARSDVDFWSSDVVCLDTSGMGANEDMQVAQYYNVLSQTWSECRLNADTGRPLLLIADEGQNMLSSKMSEAADMVQSIAKRIRKLNAGLMFICQDVDDLFDESVRKQGAAVFNNATYRIVGHADGTNLEQVAELLKLEEGLKERIAAAKRGEFAVWAGTDSTWCEYEAPDWELRLFGKLGGPGEAA